MAYIVGMRAEIAEYDSRWPRLFQERGERLRRVLGDVAPRIDHIGSTSIPHLAAKPIIDIQISVAAFEPLLAAPGLHLRVRTDSRTAA